MWRRTYASESAGAMGVSLDSSAGVLSAEVDFSDVEDPLEDPIVQVAEAWSPAEAEILCSLLRAHDVLYILKAENQYAVDASYTVGPLARRRILVRESDVVRAREILEAVPSPDPPLEA